MNRTNKAKFLAFCSLVRQENSEEIQKFLAEHANNETLMAAIKVFYAVKQGIADAQQDVAEVLKKVTTNPN